MKKLIIEILKDRGNTPLTIIARDIQESKGELSMYLPIAEGYNPNVLMCSNVNADFIEALNSLITSKEITYEPCSIMIYMFDQAPIFYKPKLVNDNHLRKGCKTHCWMPILVNKGINFNTFTI